MTPAATDPDRLSIMTIKLSSQLLASLLLSTGIASAQTSAAQPQVIRLQRFRKALWTVRVSVAGTSGDFLFDTGGGNTLVTEEFSSRMKCDFWGRTTGYNMFGKRNDGPHCDDVQLTAGSVSLTPVNVAKIDFGQQFEGDRTPDGLLSLDAFDGKAITIDQVAGTLTIETDQSLVQRTKDMRELPFRVSRECSARCLSVFVAVPTRRGTTWLILDSGAGGVSLISKDYAGAFGLDPAGKEQRLQHDIAPGVHVDSPVVVTDLIMDGNLGQPFMSQYVLTMDLRTSRCWIRANSAR